MKQSQLYITCVGVHFSFKFPMKQTWLLHLVFTAVKFSSFFYEQRKDYLISSTYTPMLERSFRMALDLLISSLQRVNNLTEKGWLKMGKKKKKKDEQQISVQFQTHLMSVKLPN